ncbi:hypothetical protein F8388_011176 [Cannabis sativa]|uniref:Uncharacterized protein n=1 Tax=Cannabis sativa TaxID=3483 RepID=A0A7J6EG48_CANSA|nr:hypothetical protein F8388_011176 [Cannabis sativa]
MDIDVVPEGKRANREIEHERISAEQPLKTIENGRGFVRGWNGGKERPRKEPKGRKHCSAKEMARIKAQKQGRIRQKGRTLLRPRRRMVKRVGLSGGLMLMWEEGLKVKILSHSKFHIHMAVCDLESRIWNFTGVYGDPVKNQWHSF